MESQQWRHTEELVKGYVPNPALEVQSPVLPGDRARDVLSQYPFRTIIAPMLSAFVLTHIVEHFSQ